MKNFFKNQTRDHQELPIEVDNELELHPLIPSTAKEKSIDFSDLNEALPKIIDDEFLIIEKCHSMSSALETFITLVASFFMRIPQALGVLIKFKGHITFLSDQHIFNIIGAMKNFKRSFLFAYQTSLDNSGLIYWRPEGIEQIFYCVIGKNNEDVIEFIGKFLMKCLKNGHNGLYSHFNFNRNKLSISVSLDILCDFRGYNLLLYAVEAGNAAIVKIFLSLGFDVNFVDRNGKTAADLAYEGKHYDILLMLLKNNAKYPSDFIESDDFSDDLKNFIDFSKKFHDSIREDDKEEVIQALDDFPNLKHFYNIQNISAVATSILSKSFDIYKLLINENVFLGTHESFNNLRNELNEDELILLRDCHNESSQNFMEDHIMVLMGNSSVGPDEPDNQSKLSYALKAFQIIDRIPQISLILKIVAALKNFKITFDFKRDDVSFLDPFSESYTNGVFYTTGRIYIAAKRLLDESRMHEVCGTIAHELCHLVMFKLFDNFANPYAVNDTNRLEDFTEITRECEELKELEDIISWVYECYEGSQRHAELIVRVPHMLAHYFKNPAKLEELQTSFASLFEFFNNICMPAMEKALPRFIEEGKKTKIEKKQKKQIKALIWSLLILFILGGTATAAGILITYQNFMPEPSYSWKNATDDVRNEIMNGDVNFQGIEMKLKDFVAFNSTSLYSLTTDDVFNLTHGSHINVSDMSNTKVDFYVERTYLNKSQDVFTRDEIFEFLNDKREFLLSDYPGAGKTTTFKSLANAIKVKYPYTWVSYIDLKKHTDAFKSFNGSMTREEVFDLLINKIFKLNSFESEIFKASYLSCNVTFLWDGVDEISPNYEATILRLINFLKSDLKNLNLVSTRTFLEKKIQSALNIEVFRLKPFNSMDRQIFIEKFMQFKKKDPSTFKNESSIILGFFDKMLNQTCDEDNPLMLQMICTIHFENDKLEDGISLLEADIYSVYYQFVNYKLKIMRDIESPVVRENIMNIQGPKGKKTKSMIETHQYYAIQSLFKNDSVATSLNFMKYERPNYKPEEISRYGILEIDNDGNTYFIHRTFAEYFVAQYVIHNVMYIDYKPTITDLTTRLAFIRNLLDDSYQRFAVVRNFIMEYSKNIKEDSEDKMSKEVIDLYHQEANGAFKDHFELLYSLIYHYYNSNTLLGYFEFLASLYKGNYEVFKIYWHIESDENAFMFLIRELKSWKVENQKWFERFLKFIQRNLSKENLIPNELSFASSKYSGSILYYIWREKYRLKKTVSPEMVVEWAAIDNIEELLEIKNVTAFLSYIKATQSEESFKNVLISEYPEIVLSLFGDDLKKFLNWSSTVLTPDEMDKALAKHDYREGSVLHNAFRFDEDNLNTVLNLYEDFCYDKIGDYLLSTESVGRNPLHRMIYLSSNAYQVDTFWNFTLKHVKDTDQILKTITTYGKDLPLNLAMNSYYKFEKFTKIYEDKFGKKKLTEIILSKMPDDNILHSYIYKGSSNIDIIKYLNKTLSFNNDQFRTLLRQRNEDGETPFGSAIKKGKTNLLKPLEFLFTSNELNELKSEENYAVKLQDQTQTPSSCKLKVELPKAIEIYEDLLDNLGARELFMNWMEKNRKQIDEYIDKFDVPQIKESLSRVDLQKYNGSVKVLVDTFGIDSFLNLSPQLISQIVSNVDGILCYAKTDLIDKFVKIVNLIGFKNIEKVIPVLFEELKLNEDLFKLMKEIDFKIILNLLDEMFESGKLNDCQNYEFLKKRVKNFKAYF